MNILELKEVVDKLIADGKGHAKLYVSDGGAGVADGCSIGSDTTEVGEETKWLDGSILDETKGTEVVFMHYN